VVVIIGARIVDDGASGGGGGGGDGCQWGKKSLELNGVERATAGGNCYTPFPIEFDPNSGRVYAREARAVMNQFELGQGWGVTEGRTTLKVIYADGGYDLWGIQEAPSLAGFRVLDIVQLNPGNGQVKPRTTPCG
jgi:hypothetical protein